VERGSCHSVYPVAKWEGAHGLIQHLDHLSHLVDWDWVSQNGRGWKGPLWVTWSNPLLK